MEKSREFPETRFSVEVIENAALVLKALMTPMYQELVFQGEMRDADDEKRARLYAHPGDVPVPDDLIRPRDMMVWFEETKWTHDSFEEFKGDLRKEYANANIELKVNPKYHQIGGREWTSAYWVGFAVENWARKSRVVVKQTNRSAIEQLMGVFESAAPANRLPPLPVAPAPKPRVFIGHGRSELYRDLKDHLRDQHGFDVEAYETGSRAGHTIRDVLDDMLNSSTFAILVMTAEDEQADATMRARQNVVHEAGLFQGRLGFSKTLILLEEGTEPFSNIDGIQYIGFAPGRIRETFGDVLATLRREFPQA